VLVRLPKAGEKDLDVLLLHELRQVSRYGWRTLEEMNRFLERYDLRLVLIFDDLQRWVDTTPDFVRQLKDLIAEHSEWHSLYWLVTARDRSLQPFRGGREFWLEYGFYGSDEQWGKALEPIPTTDGELRKTWLEQMEQAEAPKTEVPHVGGWISLDDLNQESKTGLIIVSTQIEEPVNFELMEVASQRHVCVPFIAWIVVDLIRAGAIQPDALRSIRFVSFVERFWSLKREQIEQWPRGEETVAWMEQVVAWIADYCVQHNSSEEVRARLLAAIVNQADGWSAELSNPEQAKMVLTALELENLLEWDWKPHDGIRIAFEKLKFDTFWQYHLARQLYYRPAFQNQDLEGARKLLEQCFPAEHELALRLQEGMLEFLFLMLDDAGVQAVFIDALVESALDLLPAWRHAIWYAGTKGSRQFQKTVMGWAVDHADKVASEQDVFGRLYLLRGLGDDNFTLTTRFCLLSPLYDAIADHGLEALYWDLAQRWFAQPFETNDVLESLIYLNGTEKMGLGEEVAEVSFAALAERAKAEDDTSAQMLDWILGFLTTTQNLIQQNRIEWTAPEYPWRRERYLEWLLSDFCQWFIERKGLDAYYVLDEHGWFQKGNWWPLGVAMEREANIALGYACRKLRSSEKREEYVDIVSHLLRSQDKNNIIRAFYMAWHADWYHSLFKDVRARMKSEPHLERKRNDPQYKDFFK